MIEDVLSERVRELRPANAIEQENLLKELIQHFILASQARHRFFSHAAFHGGTCLRILWRLRRFSEDLDFLLRQPDDGFRWAPYLEKVRGDLEAEGLDVEVQERSSAGRAVKGVLLKTTLDGTLLARSLPHPRDPRLKVRIKLEIDTNPPPGSRFETRFLTFPMTAAITAQTLESSFALKSHALLCRRYTKGRDWYDFLWYSAREVMPQLELLGNALNQQGPWAGQAVVVTPGWYLQALRKRIEEIDWQEAAREVARFVPANEQEALALWSRDLFVHHLDRLRERQRREQQ